MGKAKRLPVQNLRSAVRRFGALGDESRQVLRALTTKFSLSVAGGDLTLISGKWYVTHSGLLQLAHRNRCSGIETKTVPQFCEPTASRWVIKATVFKTPRSKGFVGYGDADPTNVSAQVRGAELRVAETRAVNRAIRKAYGIGICSVEEIGAFPAPPDTAAPQDRLMRSTPANGNGTHPLRDRLCLLIRKHGLDANLVKLYAADFCGTQELHQASREQIRKFVIHLAQYAEHDRDGLLSHLNSYVAKPVAPAVPDVSQGQEKTRGAA